MNITYKNATKKMPKKFQQGGAVDAPIEQEAPEQNEGELVESQEDPMIQLAQVFAQGLQNQDCQMLAQGAQMFLQMLQQQAPAQNEGEPVFAKNGAKLLYRLKK